ncbi:MAG TPA: twin-arginine translocase TatA/TatE family subunit [Actinomycetota bacterium]|nr:twin-arginine translocase TatA/TatE family subunit [Actinomycetota bacterium]HMC79959.1 twin-arginine translocase TatA/TatE family subunit [Acidimicrobiia bacterium]
MDLFTPGHIVLVLVAALVIFGPKRLPDIGKSLGKGIKEFKGAMSHIADDVDTAPPPSQPMTPNAGAAPAPAPPPPATAPAAPSQPPAATPVAAAPVPPAPPAAAPPSAQSNGTAQS